MVRHEGGRIELINEEETRGERRVQVANDRGGKV
jgi:hypothetical protein